MIFEKTWRVLTVGDGDLSFSHALQTSNQVSKLTASTYDDEQTIRDKYQHHALDLIKNSQMDYLPAFDVTGQTSWQRLNGQQYDLAIFQFPLIPAFSSHAEFKQSTLSVNTLNRRLLRLFLDNAYRYALDPNGPMLCYITSKDVKPYCEWDLESSLCLGSNMQFLGLHDFNITQFPGYQIRNVDRDKHVKDTSGTTFVFGAKTLPDLASQLYIPKYLNDEYCSFCRAGPFHSEVDQQSHLNSKKHRAMEKHQQAWLSYLSSCEQHTS